MCSTAGHQGLDVSHTEPASCRCRSVMRVPEVEVADLRTLDAHEGAGQSRASDRDHQASIWFRQSALWRAQEEHSSLARDLRARQFVHGAPASIALRCGVICLAWLPMVADAEDVSPITASPIPNCHWLLQFQWPRSTPAPLFRPSLKYRLGQYLCSGRYFRSTEIPEGARLTNMV